jgi:hypothetical protein
LLFLFLISAILYLCKPNIKSLIFFYSTQKNDFQIAEAAVRAAEAAEEVGEATKEAR